VVVIVQENHTQKLGRLVVFTAPFDLFTATILLRQVVPFQVVKAHTKIISSPASIDQFMLLFGDVAHRVVSTTQVFLFTFATLSLAVQLTLDHVAIRHDPYTIMLSLSRLIIQDITHVQVVGGVT
jgi:hypothetical protein